MIRDVILWPDARLKAKSEPIVDPASGGPPGLSDDLIDTMRHLGGVGLAAVQIGVPVRMIAIHVGEIRVLINPRIVFRGGDKEGMAEGCLSLPGIVGTVQRHSYVEVEAYEYRQPARIRAHGQLAQVLQHEIDHLDGKMYVDRLDPGAKDRVRAQLRRRR